MISLSDPLPAVNPRGVVLFEGPSKLDGQPIVAIATLSTKNGKTGPMVQTWVMRADMPPVQALHCGASDSVCGDCPLQGTLRNVSFGSHPLGPIGETTRRVGNACYVRVEQAPRGIWHAWQAGRYPRFDPDQHFGLFAGRFVRIGSYGEPMAVPIGPRVVLRTERN